MSKYTNRDILKMIAKNVSNMLTELEENGIESEDVYIDIDLTLKSKDRFGNIKSDIISLNI